MKNKINVKKISNILSVIIIFLLGVVLGVFLSNIKDNEIKGNNGKNDNVYFDAVKINDCIKEIKEYKKLDNNSVYLYCLEDIKINDSTLKEYLDEHDISEIINDLEVEAELNDGGTKIYKNNDFILIKCNKLEGNKNIYIGPVDMNYQKIINNNLCDKEMIKDTKFTKTYKVQKIIQGEEENLFYLTLSAFQSETDTVLVRLDEKLTEGKNYEFTFDNSKINTQDNIKSIFNNSKLISIKETDKTGLDQISENIK